MPAWLPRTLRWGAVVCLLSAHAGAQEADSVTRDAARSLGLSGVEAYQAGDFAVASDRLEKAYKLINAPSLGLWSARALVKRNLLVEAAKRYLEAAGLQLPQGDAGVQRQAQVDAQAELEHLRPQIPRLVIRVNGADPSNVTLSIDGEAVPASVIGTPRLVNPGQHRVEAQLGAAQKSAAVELRIGQEASALLDFSAPRQQEPLSPPSAPSAPSSTRRTLGWIGIGAGGVGVALGSVMGGLALGKHASLQSSSACSNGRCSVDKQGDVNTLDTFRAVSSIGFIAGGALAATGIVLLLTAPSNEQRLAATISGESITLTGRF